MNKNLLIRTAVAAVAIPIILWICYQDRFWLSGLITLLFLVALSEFLIAERVGPRSLAFCGFILAGIFHMVKVVVMVVGAPLFDCGADPLIIWILSLDSALLVLVCAGVLFAIGKRTPFELFSTYSRIIWGVIYLFTLYPFVIYVGSGIVLGPKPDGSGYLDAPLGGDWLLFLFGLLWLGDSAAMFVGKAFGKHKLAPAVSPNKTVEGFIGGIVGAIVVAIILGFWRLDMIPMWQLVIIAIFCSIFGQLGDLVESMWKRSLGIKDSSAIIPGHGGVLDRFDSLLFAAPVMYYAMLLIGK